MRLAHIKNAPRGVDNTCDATEKEEERSGVGRTGRLDWRQEINQF